MRRVLVTGASGFIGGHILGLLLERGFEVHAVSSRNSPKLIVDCKWHKVDLLDYKQTQEIMELVKPTHLIHLAWDTTPTEYWQSIDNFKWLQASLELLQEFQKIGGKRVVMAGTCAEYDWEYGYCSEYKTPRNPKSIYGICKNNLQSLLASFSDITNLSSAWGRIFFVYGPNQHPQKLVSSVIGSLLLDKPVSCSHGNQIRDFLYVEDVANAFVSLLVSDVQGAVNIASGRSITLKEIINIISEQLGRPDLIRFGKIPEKDESPLIVADVRRLYNEVGWSKKYKIEEGLHYTIEWWREQLSIN
jgi:nucleoside-diphosphate-sugar epimerase